MFRIFLPLCFVLFLAACGNNTPTENYDNPDELNIAQSPENELYSIEGFWKKFQDAVTKGNKKRLQELTKIEGETMDYYDDLFFSKAREQVKNMTVANIETDEMDGEQFYKITIDMSDENGANGLIFHIGIKNDLYCITKIRVAGAAL